MHEAGTIACVEPRPTSSDRDATDLGARWREALPDGGTRRDEVLRALRAGAAPPRDLRAISLVGEDLREVDLSGCDLRDADLTDANVRHAVLSRCDLRGATLVRAVLDESELMGANLAGAHLGECSARRAGLGLADLSGAGLFQADLSAATLTGTRLCRADLRAALLEGARLREADLTGADLTRARLGGADLAKSTVHGCAFDNADLRDAHLRAIRGFERARWIGVDIRDVDFSGAYLLRRWIVDENYLFELRTRSRYGALVYGVWWLTSDCGRSAWRWLAWNLAVALLFGGLYLLLDVDYGPHPTALSSFYYSFVTLTTLGYGDVVPASAGAQVAAVVEVLLGYVGLGGLLSILANKMARRGE